MENLLIAAVFAIFLLILVFGPIYLAITLASYSWLWLWTFLLFLPDTLLELTFGKQTPLSDKEITEAVIREIKSKPNVYRALMNK